MTNPAVEALKPCPFCGSAGKKHDHGYGDDSCSAGCSNRECHVYPQVSACPRSFPHDETKQTFWVDWDTAEKAAIEAWNRRAQAEQTPVASVWRDGTNFRGWVRKTADGQHVEFQTFVRKDEEGWEPVFAENVTPVAEVAKAGRVVGVNEMRGMMIAYGMRAVANETGVSPSTVSRFCAGHDIYLSVYLPLLNWCSSKIAAPVYHKEES